MVAQHPQGGAFGALACVDAFNEFGRLAHLAADGHRIVGQHDQLGASVAHLVRHVEWAAGEMDGVEGGAVEDVLDAVVQFGAGVAGINIALLAANDLVEVRLRQKAHRGAGAVIQIGGLGNEPFAGLFNEAQVQGRPQHGIAQLLWRQALQRFVEGQGVHEDGAGGVCRVGRQAAVVLGVNVLREGTAFAMPGGDVIGDGRREGGLAQAGDDLLANRLEAQVDVMQMEGRGVRRPLPPKMGDAAGEQAQHAAHTLELADGAGLGGQRLQHFGMQRIAGCERLGGFRPAGLFGQLVAVFGPQLAVGVDHRANAIVVDALEQAAAQHLRQFVVFGGVQQRGFAGGNALRLRHPVGHELVFLAVGVGGLAVAAKRQGVNQRCVGSALHGLEQGGEKGGELIAGALAALHLAQIHREFVQQNQRRLAAEQLLQGFGAWGHAFLVTVLHPLVARPSSQRVCDLAPRRMRQHAFLHRPAIGGVGVLAIECGDAHRAARQQRGIDELRHILHALHASRRVNQRDQAMRLAAAVRGVQAEDGRRFAANAA